jgi:hypothetical protein
LYGKISKILLNKRKLESALRMHSAKVRTFGCRLDLVEFHYEQENGEFKRFYSRKEVKIF